MLYNIFLSLLTVAAPTCVHAQLQVASAWYAGWHSDGQSTPDFKLADVPWEKYTHLTYAFAETSPDVNALDISNSNPDLLPSFVSTAKENGVKALVSVGGWTGSRFFSSAVNSAGNRTAFVKTISDFAAKYELDGIDFDWEYPNNQGLGCNTISSSDTANFLSFLQELRKDPVGANLLLSAATATTPFRDASGEPAGDVSGFADVLDWVAVMNYDIWGPWSETVGPNAPLNDTCAPENAQVASAVSAVQTWTDAGFPREKLVLGVPSYGHSFKVPVADAFEDEAQSKLKLYPSFDSNSHPAGDVWDDEAGVDACGVQQNQGGNWNFWGLIDGGWLTADGETAEGIDSIFDDCAQTPFVYDRNREVMVSFDNVQSMTAKGRFISENGLAGFAMWEAGADSKTMLIDAVRGGAGFGAKKTIKAL